MNLVCSTICLAESCEYMGTIMEQYKKLIISTIEKNKHELFELVAELVRIPSVVGNEEKAQEWIFEQYKKIGLNVLLLQADREKICHHPAFIDSGISYKNRPNVIGILEGDTQYRSLTLNGHIDVVSPEPIDAWSHNPWGGKIQDGKLFGRGSCDMKGGLISNYFALKTLIELGLKPKGTVILQSVIEEEAGGGGGTLSCMLDKDLRTTGFISSEPHGLRVVVSHAGVLYFKIKIIGKTAHGGEAHLGVNAIEKMCCIVDALKKLNEKRQSELRYELFENGSGKAAHLNVGKMRAGDWPSTVAGFADLECRISFIPGETRDDVKKLIEDTVKNVAIQDEWLKNNQPTVDWFGWSAEPWYQDPNSSFVKGLQNSAFQVLGHSPVIIGRASGNDARFTQYFENMDGVCFGPVGGNMHGIDEYVTLDSLVKTSQILALHCIDWCGLRQKV